MIALVEPEAVSVGARGRLLEGEAHHLRVRRAREGEQLELRDGAGLVAHGRLIASGDDWEVEIERAERRPPPAALVLGVGAGDRDRFATIVEKAVELGVTRLAPLVTERVAGVASRIRPNGLDRIRRQALEAVKQSGNPWACVVDDPVPLSQFLARAGAGVRWIADAEGHAPPATLRQDAVIVIVGPEGGLTSAERDAATAAGFRPVSFGPHVLRFETAALAAAAAVQTARHRGRDG